MTRTSRTLLILILMSIGTVVVLAMMAQRYSRVLEDRRKARTTDARASHVGVRELPEAEAGIYVEAYLQVMATLRETIDSMDESTSGDQARVQLRSAFEQALTAHGLDRPGFQEMDGVIRAWEQGSAEVPEAYRRELVRRADEVRASRIEGYDPLERH
jgi:hypothetical protein